MCAIGLDECTSCASGGSRYVCRGSRDLRQTTEPTNTFALSCISYPLSSGPHYLPPVPPRLPPSSLPFRSDPGKQIPTRYPPHPPTQSRPTLPSSADLARSSILRATTALSNTRKVRERRMAQEFLVHRAVDGQSFAFPPGAVFDSCVPPSTHPCRLPLPAAL